MVAKPFFRWRRLVRAGLLLACLAVSAAQAADAPDLILAGRLDHGDHRSYLELPFEVPEGVARITVAFSHDGHDQRTTIDLGLIGPDGMEGVDGLRGWSGGNKQIFTVSGGDATPSYLPGPIRPGQWRLLLGVPNLRPDVTTGYRAEVHFTRVDAAADEPDLLQVTLADRPGWYRGDLHLHTGHSDGSCDSQSGRRVPCPLFLSLSTAAERGLDFVSVTEHNTASHGHGLRELQPYFDRLLLIPGREITTFQGHVNLIGHLRPVDFRLGSPSIPDWNTLLARMQAPDAVISINHPIRPNDETCMGCGWTPLDDVDLSRVDAVEVVNNGDADSAYSGVPVWQAWLSEGHRITAIGGSDNHDALQTAGRPGSTPIGIPSTVVHARALNRAAILDGIRSGRVYIALAGDPAHHLEFEARLDDAVAPMGANLQAAAGRRVELLVRVDGIEQPVVELVEDGTAGPLRPGETWESDGGRHWLRIDVRDREGRLLLLGNPIYINWPE